MKRIAVRLCVTGALATCALVTCAFVSNFSAADDEPGTPGANKPSPVAAEYRTWTNSKGKQAVLAYLDVEGNAVLLRDRAGKQYRFPLEELSEKDQLFVKGKLATGAKQPTPLAPFTGKGAKAILRDLAALNEKPTGKSHSISKQARELLKPATQKLIGTSVEQGMFVSSNLFDEEKFIARYGQPDQTGKVNLGTFKGRYLRYEWIALVVAEDGEIHQISTAFTGLYKQ